MLASPLHRLAGAGVAVFLAVAVTGCTSDEGGSVSAPQANTGDAPARTRPALPQDEGGPLEGLPPCESPPAAAASAADVDGLLLPKGSVVTSVTENGPLVTVQGYVEQTPITVRRFYQEADGLELFEIEDEVFEAETLFGSGEYRTYVKASAACAEGSTLLAVVGPAGDLPPVGG